MARNNERISINALEKFCKHTCPEDVVELKFATGENEEIVCTVKKRLSLEETIRFIEGVVSKTIMENDMMIAPVAREFVLRKSILTYYANFALPESDSKAYELVMGATDIVYEILDVIDQYQYNAIQLCIHERIEFEKQKMLCEQESKINKLTAEIEQLANKMSAVFDGVSGDQMADFITSMSGMAKNTEITAQDLANAFVSSSGKN